MNQQLNDDDRILFINASQRQNGNTARVSQRIITAPHQQLNLVDYKIYQIGQNYPDDQFAQVAEQIQQAS